MHIYYIYNVVYQFAHGIYIHPVHCNYTISRVHSALKNMNKCKNQMKVDVAMHSVNKMFR